MVSKCFLVPSQPAFLMVRSRARSMMTSYMLSINASSLQGTETSCFNEKFQRGDGLTCFTFNLPAHGNTHKHTHTESACVCVSMYACMCVHVCTCVHVHVCACMHACVHVCAHSHMCMCECMCTHVCVCVYIHTYMYWRKTRR